METIKQRDVSTAQDLIAAVSDRSVDRIVVFGRLAGFSSLELLPDQALTAAARATLQFKDDSDGIRLSSNNKLENLTLIAAPEKRAIFNDTTVTDLGCLELRNLRLTTHGSAVAPLDVEGSDESLFLKGGVTTSGG